MEPISQTVVASEKLLHHSWSVNRIPPRGASSNFVGSTIVILGSYAVATMAMNCGKKNLEQRLKPNDN